MGGLSLPVRCLASSLQAVPKVGVEVMTPDHSRCNAFVEIAVNAAVRGTLKRVRSEIDKSQGWRYGNMTLLWDDVVIATRAPRRNAKR